MINRQRIMGRIGSIVVLLINILPYPYLFITFLLKNELASINYWLSSYLIIIFYIWLFGGLIIGFIYILPSSSQMKACEDIPYEEWVIRGRERRREREQREKVQEEKEKDRLVKDSSEFIKFCTNCQSKLKRRLEFCPYCGVKL